MRLHNILGWLAFSTILTTASGFAKAGVPIAEAAETPKIIIQGALTYRARIALPPEARAVVELREGLADQGPVIADQSWALQGKQVPLPFQLVVQRKSLLSGRPYRLRGAVFVGDRPTWMTDPIAFEPITDQINVGLLSLRPVKSPAAKSLLQCGDQQITADFSQKTLRLTVGQEQFELHPVRSASGARYAATGDPSTTYWNKGDRTLITLRGQSLPECRQAQVKGVFQARGNEPFWNLEIEEARLTFKTLEGKPLVALTPRAEPIPLGRRYLAQSGVRTLTATLLDQRCVDSMSGMTYPTTVTVLTHGQAYRGCGGEPATLLQGAEWVVEDLNGTGLIDQSRMTLLFGPEGHLSGRASCNSFMGQYTLTGEGLTLSKAATTLMACPPSLMQQETKFLTLLQDVQRFEISPNGLLVLHTADGRTLTARR
jgi:heat shock protein HslJ/uncharacterized lipoprotein YbaY